MYFVIRLCVVCFLINCFAVGTVEAVYAKETSKIFFKSLIRIKADTTASTDTTAIDSTKSNAPIDTNKVRGEVFQKSGLSTDRAALYPNASIQQMLKARVAGVYVEEPSGEPGTEQSMFIRGTSIPFTSHKDVYNAQPTVILDGIPLIMSHPYAFNIQLYDYNRLGPATNLLASIDPDNIASIKVLKDFADAAVYGPWAANGGVIVIETKAPVIGGRKISVNSYVGLVQKPHVFTTNARFEKNFRQPYYDRYAGITENLTYPLYLRDSSNASYYGPSNWTDLYYKNKMIRGLSASLSSGTERANFRFAIGNQQDENSADNTKLDRYNVMFELNMVPVKWLTVSAMIKGTKLERVRNTYLRDRFAAVQYLPDLANPLPPNKADYADFLSEQDESIDQNRTNLITGYFRLNFHLSKDWQLISKFGFNYNEGLRDVFYPSTLMETVNYVSNYFGYNQRILFNNTLRWHHDWSKEHGITLEAGEVFIADKNRYNYSYVYNGPNDLIKVNTLYSDPNKSNYLSSKAFPRQLTFMFQDRQRARLLSFYGRALYDYKSIDLSVLVRADGSSSAPKDNWWFVSPTFSMGWDLKHSLMEDNSSFSRFRLHASWGRVGRVLPDDRFGEGPQYVSDMSFSNNPVKFSYDAIAGLSRPYSIGYIGSGIDWAYTDQLDIGLELGMLHNRLNMSLDVYNKVSHNMLFKVPGAAEYGYSGIYKNGLDVRNRGIEISLQANVLPESSNVQWVPFANFSYNQNELLALPDGLQELVVGKGINTRKLKVGHAIDQYWVLQNEGIYIRDKDIPVNPVTHQRMTYKGTTLRAGDPVWTDTNGDYTIDNKDKVMAGHYLPEFYGGFGSDLMYRNFKLSFSFYYVFGRKILNQDVSNHLGFANREGKISMDAIKEITYWSKVEDYSIYPLYNPWSAVQPYRLNQDLFLEDGSFLKLRNVSLQYDITGAKWWNKKSGINRLEVYVTANNLFTITPYSGRDPELVYYNGIDNGYGLPIPRTYTLGVRLSL